ncbi:vesicular glutamate transporter 3-like isoform X2 [Planococcus citri]
MLLYNLSIAVVEMTSDKVITIGNTTVFRVAEFQWDTITIGIVSCIHSYGGLIAFLGGYLVDKFGGSVSCSLSMMICGVLTILHPAILYLDYNLFLFCRFITGFFVNCFFISTAEMYSRWFPKKERSTLIAIGYNGVNVGAAIAYPLFGYIADKWGWQMVFYVSGIISLFISLLCLIIVKNRPSEDTRISESELSYILIGTDDASRKKVAHPYKKIFSSKAVFAVCVGKFTNLWITTILSLSLPLYVKDLTGKSTDEVGLISSIPAIGQILIFPITGVFLDVWKKTTEIEWTLMHKISIGFAFLSSSVFFLAAILLNNFTMSMIFFALIQIMMSIVPAITEPICVNISPNDSSVTASLSQFMGSLAIVVSRTSFGFMTTNHSSQEWNNCFLLTSGVLIFGTAVFILFGSSEAQSWSSISIFEQERDPLVKYDEHGKRYSNIS